MSIHHNQVLPKPLRTQLEATVKSAREMAEKGETFYGRFGGEKRAA